MAKACFRGSTPIVDLNSIKSKKLKLVRCVGIYIYHIRIYTLPVRHCVHHGPSLKQSSELWCWMATSKARPMLWVHFFQSDKLHIGVWIAIPEFKWEADCLHNRSTLRWIFTHEEGWKKELPHATYWCLVSLNWLKIHNDQSQYQILVFCLDKCQWLLTLFLLRWIKHIPAFSAA